VKVKNNIYVEQHTRANVKAFKCAANYLDVSERANELHLSCLYVWVEAEVPWDELTSCSSSS
jgi:hypothetical protein